MNFIFNKFIEDSSNFKNDKVREQYGIICSVISITANVCLALIKIFFGVLLSSVAVISDGLNNFADVVSNVASLLSFKLSTKHPDQDHPYGHGRLEYIIGMFIGVFILFMGALMIKESFVKLFNQNTIIYNGYACVMLLVSIAVKAYMGYLNKVIGTKIESSLLLAVSKDSYNDVLVTIATLLSLVLSPYTSLPLDGMFGIFVSIFIIKAGFDIFMDMMDPLLGKVPSKELIHEIEQFIKMYDEVLGIHDLMLHDYGPGRRFMTLHVEVDASLDMIVTHDAIDLIERELLNKFLILTTIHMDPIDIHDENTNILKNMVINVVKSINLLYTIHDFRIVVGVSHTNLVFDILVPIDDEINHIYLKELVNSKLQEIDCSYYTVIQVDHSYV